MNCSKCGAPLREGVKFCTKCGAKVGAERDAFCGECGAKLAADDAFCPECGAPVGGAAAEPEKKRRGRPPKAKTELTEINRAPRLSPEMRPSYPAWTAYCNWRERQSRCGAGNPEYHFLLDHGRVLRVRAEGTETVPVRGLPCRPEYIFWADGLLWLTEEEIGESFRIYSVDPETFESKLEVDLSEVCRSYNLSAPYVTASAIYVGTYEDSDWRILRWDRRSGTLTVYHVFREAGSGSIYTCFIGDESICAFVSENHQFEALLLDKDGKACPLYKAPAFAPMLPVIAELTGKKLPQRANCDNDADFAESMSMFLMDTILFVDFETQKVYVGSSAREKANVRTQQWRLPFGATETYQAQRTWEEPKDFSLARKDEHRKGVHFEGGTFLFDGKHAAGTTDVGSNFDWCFQTAEGQVVNTQYFDRCESEAVLLGDSLYIYGSMHEPGWNKLELDGSKFPEIMPIAP